MNRCKALRGLVRLRHSEQGNWVKLRISLVFPKSHRQDIWDGPDPELD